MSDPSINAGSFRTQNADVPSKGGKGQSAKLIDLPPSLPPLPNAPQVVEGEVQNVSRDGNVTIETPRGDVQVKLPPQYPVKQGQRVEVEIPKQLPDRPVRQVVVRVLQTVVQPTPQQAQQQVKQQATTQIQTPNQTKSASKIDGGENVVKQGSGRQTAVNPNVFQTIVTSGQATEGVKSAKAQLGNTQGQPLKTLLKKFVQKHISGQAGQLTKTDVIKPASALDQIIRFFPLKQGADVIKPEAQHPVQKSTLQVILSSLQSSVVTGKAQEGIKPENTIKTLPLPITEGSITPKVLDIILSKLDNSCEVFKISSPFVKQTIQSTKLTIQPELKLSSALPQGLLETAKANNPVLTKPADVITQSAQATPKPVPFLAQITSVGSETITLQPVSEDGQKLPSVPVEQAANPHVKSEGVAKVIEESRATLPELKARIVGFTPQQQPVVQFQTLTPNPLLPDVSQLYVMDLSSSELTLGSQVTLTAMQTVDGVVQQSTAIPISNAGQITVQSPIPQPIPSFMQPGIWGAMDDIFKSIQQSAVEQAIPNPVQGAMAASTSAPVVLGAAAILFVAAARGGDLNSWFGDRAMNAVRGGGKMDVFQSLTREAAGVTKPSREQAGAPEWRGQNIPVYHDGDIHRVAMWYRQERDEGQKQHQDEEDKQSTRFVFDMSLDKMGPVQVDGLIREKRMDMIVRTAQDLSTPMKKHMRVLYINALDQVDLYGELYFQSGASKMITADDGSENWSSVLG